MVKGNVVQFRRGKRTVTPRHFLIEVEKVNSREEAKKFVGHHVEWKSPGKEPTIIKGKIASAHGNKGIVRAIFEKGLPGQSIGSEVEISGGKK